MAGINNLIVSTPEQARENGRKGGQASAAAYRRKKAMKEVAALVLGAPAPVDKRTLNELTRMGFGTDDANVQLQALLSIAKRAIKGDLPSMQFLRDTAGENPAQKLDVNQTVTGDFVLEIAGESDADDTP